MIIRFAMFLILVCVWMIGERKYDQIWKVTKSKNYNIVNNSKFVIIIANFERTECSRCFSLQCFFFFLKLIYFRKKWKKKGIFISIDIYDGYILNTESLINLFLIWYVLELFSNVWCFFLYFIIADAEKNWTIIYDNRRKCNDRVNRENKHVECFL